MKALKFGGSSLRNLDGLLRSCQITQQQLSNSRGIIVVSALGGVTNTLEQAIDAALTGQDSQTLLEDLTHRHQQRVQEVSAEFPEQDFTDCQKTVDEALAQCARWLQGIQLTADASDHTKARILGLGEYLSAQIFHYTLSAQNPEKNIQQLNSQDYLFTRGPLLEGHVDEEKSHEKIKQLTSSKGDWFIAPGFVATHESGQTGLLGRNGSDLSAAIFAAGLSVEELQIWTDVDGVYNADPNVIPQAQVIHHLSYHEAMELSFFGAKVLHPKTIAPIATYQIPTYIKNTFNPLFTGTRITEEGAQEDRAVTGITMLDDLAMLNVSGTNMKGEAGLASRVFSCLSREKISVIMISQSSSEYSIAFSVNAQDAIAAKKALEKEFALEIKHHQMEPVELRSHLSSITVVGDNMKQTHGIAANLFNALASANVNIIAIAQDSSERSISAIVRSAKVKTAVNKTYEYFFECPRIISVVLYGVGTIGAELIQQIQQQQQHLLKQRIDIRVIAIANSRQLLWNEQGIALDNYQEALANSSSNSSIDELLNLCQQGCPLNPVFVDCTSNDDLAMAYTRILDSGLHLVAANKKANTASMKYYNALRDSTQHSLKKFCYETNVGAGLPIIGQVQNLVRSGDKLQAFDGILSGSLSYIMGRLQDGLTFSKAVIEAKEKGFTEPDPRDDLSGMDIARKLLIIAREFGLEAELSDVEIDPLLPSHFNANGSVEDFLSRLPELDGSYTEKNQAAEQHSKALRYAGTIEPDGKMKVQLLAVDSSHPLFGIRDGENAFSFTTQRYNPVPLVIRGYGAGAEVTAAGVFGDILQTIVA
ncbi:bifunctional aspartate kinase/homoserine dehydrogenase I [Pleionea sp. CnH1-48]|uniref:bifunctional aspartate kinase/homoserine dehydrogenase I n=1 Tax=Pleionea sp. CnH1-48 TaxID=2954494 RepID=UPI0020981F60|nr:bifunctional aspartate kinase/homoserine dehydrogenase I [Pleionea sp. CnH1-48]MCO7226776.1 bifunctional aspartate kinase/homoserine dehydrogenase I [Pleionea sp. CnH1-48]